MTATEKPLYRTLFVGRLRQTTALSVGGRDLPGSVTDSPLCRDGRNRFTLRGQTLAGALVATARRLEDVPVFVSGDISRQDKKNPPPPSRWRSFASHPEGAAPRTEIRQHVRIDPKTGAAEDNGLFNLEVLPAGTCWPFLLEVDSAGDDGEFAEALARRALAEWEAGRCYIGREVARGLGWMRLEALRAVRLYGDDPEHLAVWPDSSRSGDYPGYVAELAERLGDAGATVLAEASATAPRVQVLSIEVPFRIRVGVRDNGYGLDSLSIGGHGENEVQAARQWQDAHFISSDTLRPERRADLFDPDFALVMTGPPENRRPFIPGSALRGPLRHALERHYRAAGEWAQRQPLLRQFFGALEHGDDGACAAALLISDAELIGDGWQAAWLQLHAEDEFTAGAFGASKFDRLALFAGEFQGRMVLETTAENRAKLEPLLEQLKALARRGEIAVGGGQWRGHGWVSWHFDSDERKGAAA